MRFERAAEHGHAEGARRAALLTLTVEGEPSEAAQTKAFHSLLQSCLKGSTEAAYNLGAFHARHATASQSDRHVLLAYAKLGVGPAAFMAGLLEASEEAVQELELPQPDPTTVIWE